MGLPWPFHHDSVYGACARCVPRQGRLCRISDALAEVAVEEGAEIHTSSPVARVLLEGRHACGIELTDGEKIYCDDVVINADFGHAMSTLFEEKSLGPYAFSPSEAQIFLLNIHDVSRSGS